MRDVGEPDFRDHMRRATGGTLAGADARRSADGRMRAAHRLLQRLAGGGLLPRPRRISDSSIIAAGSLRAGRRAARSARGHPRYRGRPGDDRARFCDEVLAPDSRRSPCCGWPIPTIRCMARRSGRRSASRGRWPAPKPASRDRRYRNERLRGEGSRRSCSRSAPTTARKRSATASMSKLARSAGALLAKMSRPADIAVAGRGPRPCSTRRERGARRPVRRARRGCGRAWVDERRRRRSAAAVWASRRRAASSRQVNMARRPEANDYGVPGRRWVVAEGKPGRSAGASMARVPTRRGHSCCSTHQASRRARYSGQRRWSISLLRFSISSAFQRTAWTASRCSDGELHATDPELLHRLGRPAGRGPAQTDKLIIGVMGDQSGVVADVGGKGSVLAARMAVADFGGQVLGRKVEILSADHQNKADIGASIARRWFDVDGVDMIVDLPNSAVALAVADIAREKQKALMVRARRASRSRAGPARLPRPLGPTARAYRWPRPRAPDIIKGRGELVLPHRRLQLRPRSGARRQRHDQDAGR